MLLKRFFVYGLRNIRKDRIFVLMFVFVAAGFVIQFGPAVLNSLMYIMGKKPGIDIMFRYLLPIGSFLFLASLFFVSMHKEVLKLINKWRYVILGILYFIAVIAIVFFRFKTVRGFDFNGIEWIVAFSGLPGDAYVYVLLAFPIIFYFTWCRRRLNYKLLFLASLILFFFSFVSDAGDIVNGYRGYLKTEYDKEYKIYLNEVFERDDIDTVYLLYPAEENDRLYNQYAKISFKESYKYYGMVYEEYFELPEEERENSIVFVEAGYEFPCEKLEAGKIFDLYYCNETE